MAKIAKISVTVATCPHGMPRGACPICNGSGAGGGTSSKKADFSAKPGKWSYSKCAYYGQLLKLQKLKRETLNQDVINARNNAIAFQKNMDNLILKFNNIIQNIINKTPENIRKIANIVVTKSLNIFKNIILNPVNFVKNTLFNLIKKSTELLKFIQNNLVAILGEIKNFWQRKITKKFIDLPKKLFKIFGFFYSSNNENKKNNIDEEKFFSRINKIKIFLTQLFNIKGN